jgi:hypothetical protein
VWRTINQSVAGAHHRRGGEPCQDFSLVRVVGDRELRTLVACVADGAGTARLSHVGARVACETFMAAIIETFQAYSSPVVIGPETLARWCKRSRQAIDDHAWKAGCPPRELATTLCAAIVTPGQSAFLQIGDGAIVTRRHGALGAVFWPQSGEYLNTTSFLTSDDFSECLQATIVDFPVDDVAIFTDGLERLALRFDWQVPHVPFFQPLFAAVRGATDPRLLAADLKDFLESDAVNQRNDDDKSLLLACRIADENWNDA